MVVQTARDAGKVHFDERGLVPCVMQDARSGEVLTLAYMRAEDPEAKVRELTADEESTREHLLP